jgi:hypothetical protein
MTHLWDSFIAHWVNWVIPFATWIFGTVMGATFRWFYPSRKEWEEQRRCKAEDSADSTILNAIRDEKLWGAPVPGQRRFQAAQIAGVLTLDVEAVRESLERLEARGKVRRGGTNVPSLPPFWMVVPQ